MRPLLFIVLCLVFHTPFCYASDIYVGPWANQEEARLSGQVSVLLGFYATLTAKKVEDASVEIGNQGDMYSQFIVYEASGENSFSAMDGSNLSYMDFRSPNDPYTIGSGTIGRTDAGTAFNFGDNGQEGLVVSYANIVGGGTSDQATVINLRSDAEFYNQTTEGSVTGFVELNFEGSRFQTFEGIDNLGEANTSSHLSIGGSNSNPGPKGSGTNVGIGTIHGGRNGHVTSVTVGSTDDGTLDFYFSTESYVAGGNFAFYYNGATALHGDELSIGTLTDDTSVLIGGANNAATVWLTNLIGGADEHATTLIVDGKVSVRADDAQNNLNIINNNLAPGSVVLENAQDGVLNLGGTGSNIFLKWVNANGEGLRINSLAGQEATLELGRLETQSGVNNFAKITLGNARLALAGDGSGLNYGSGGSRFMMDSADGRSYLDAAQVTGDFDFGLGKEPTIKVGGGGNVVIENNQLVYQGALESSQRTRSDFDGQVDFSGAGDNRLIFYSHGQNTFNGGFNINDSLANIEFAGASFLNGFTDSGGESQLGAGHVYFTGLNGASDPLEASRISFAGGFINMGGATLHLNNSLFLTPVSGHIGGLGHIAQLMLGDGAGRFSNAALTLNLLGTSLSADTAAVGAAGAWFNAPVAIGGWSPMPDSISISKTLTIGGKTVINGHLGALAQTEPTFYFTANESITLTDAAQFSYIDPGAIFMIDPALAKLLKESDEGLLVFDAAEESEAMSPFLLATLAANLIFSDENLGDLTGYFSFDPFSRILAHGEQASAARPMPGYAQSMQKAAQGHNPILGQYLSRGPGLSDSRYYLELAQVMGNTMNAAINLGSGISDVLRRLTQIAILAGPLPAAQNPAYRLTDGLWLNTQMGRLTVDENYQKGASNLESNRQGLTLGYDLEAKRSLRAGLFAGINSAEMKMDWQTIESESLEAGAYAQLYLPWGFLINAAASYAWQDHQSSRDIDLRGALGETFNQTLNTDFSGDGINFQAELKRPIDFGFGSGKNFQVAPSVGYSYQCQILEPFMETSTLHTAPQYDLSTVAAGGDFTMEQLKMGADLSYHTPTISIAARAHWLQNLAAARLQSQAAFLHSPAPQPFTIYGAELDEEMAGLGLGLNYTPNPQGGPTISLAYEALMGNHTNSHSLNLGLSYNF